MPQVKAAYPEESVFVYLFVDCSALSLNALTKSEQR